MKTKNSIILSESQVRYALLIGGSVVTFCGLVLGPLSMFEGVIPLIGIVLAFIGGVMLGSSNFEVIETENLK